MKRTHCCNSTADECLSISSRQDAFALVIALVLMAFLTLLMLSLSLLLRIEVEIQRNVQLLEGAKLNALLGLQVAIGQLQEEAGHDQRTTARADIFGEPGSSSDAPTPDRQFWTGVWKTGPGAPEPSPDNAVWLVSGFEESLDIRQNNTDSSFVKILGNGTVSEQILINLGIAEGLTVPVVDIVETEGTQNGVTGRYAYWVNDEGIKAQMRGSNPYVNEMPESSAYRFSLTNSQRSAFEQMPDLGFLAAISEDDPESFYSQLDRLTSIVQAVHIGANEQHVEQLRRHYFDLTTVSKGLLTDTKNGGLRFDLGTELGKTSSDGFILTGTIFNNGPSWDLVRNFYEKYRVDPLNPVAQPRPRPTRPGLTELATAWPDDHGLAPVVVAQELALGIKTDVAAERAILTVSPIVVIANPYDVRLDNHTYLVRWSSANSTEYLLGPNVIITIYNTTDGTERRVLRSDLVSSEGVTRASQMHLNRFIPRFFANRRTSNDLRFVIRASFEPGEIKIFSLPVDSVYEVNADLPDLSTVPELDASMGLGTVDLVATFPDAVAEMMLQEGETEASISAIGLNVRTFVYSAIDSNGNEFNPIQPNANFGFGTTGSGGLGEGVYPYIMSSILTYSFPANGRRVNLFGISGTESIRNSVWLKGSYWQPSGGVDFQRRQAAVKALIHFNVRSPIHQSLESTSGLFQAAPLYAAEWSNVNQASNVDTLALWEPDAWAGSLPPSPLNPQYLLALFHLPRESLRSIAQMQHINFARDEHTPTFQVGNSFANPLIPADQIELNGVPGHTYYINDLAYLLNEALWDRYYFSTYMPDEELGAPLLLNKRMELVATPDEEDVLTDLSDPRRAAVHLNVNGAFNINSTSINAWKALLLGTINMDVPYEDLANPGSAISISETPSDTAPILRTAWPSGPASAQPSSGITSNTMWRGFRQIDIDQAHLLAREIVAEVRRRGPFRSLAEFINRKPTSNSDELDLAARGALQAAIDRSRINPLGSSDQSFSEEPLPVLYRFPKAVYESTLEIDGSRILGAPGTITQADILTYIGSLISVRSDTFIIRAYGETVDALGRSSETARIWCEAVIQRKVSYVNPETDPATPINLLSGIDAQFGRKFEVISFRWLTKDEI